MDSEVAADAKERIERSEVTVRAPRPLSEVLEDYLFLAEVKVRLDEMWLGDIADPERGPLRERIADDPSEELTAARADRDSAQRDLAAARQPSAGEARVRRTIGRMLPLKEVTWARLYDRQMLIDAASERIDLASHRIGLAGVRYIERSAARQELRQLGFDPDGTYQQRLQALAAWRAAAKRGLRNVFLEGLQSLHIGSTAADVTEEQAAKGKGGFNNTQASAEFLTKVLDHEASPECRVTISPDTKALLQKHSIKATHALEANRSATR